MAVAFVAAMGLTASDAYAEAHVPSSDSDIIERLPTSFLALRQLYLTAAPKTVAVPASDSAHPDATNVQADKTTLNRALANARRYIEVGQTYSDPRAYGYAQAALGPWWTANPAPPEVLVMRARILQFRHEFPAALTQLEAALRMDQFNPDAWLLFASIAQVQGNVIAARSACMKLIPMADPIVGATCAASTAALAGHPENAEPFLTKTLRETSAASSAERTWAWTTLAEIRERSGNSAGAQEAFTAALALSPDDVYARAANADLLLDQNRPADARALLKDPTQADALLLRAAIAAQRDHDADAQSLRDNLAERFAEAHARGDETHLREQARFALEVEHDAPRALELAQRNFAVQHEPADARILLEAAHAADNLSAAQPAAEWLRSTGIKAPRLQKLADGVPVQAR